MQYFIAVEVISQIDMTYRIFCQSEYGESFGKC